MVHSKLDFHEKSHMAGFLVAIQIYYNYTKITVVCPSVCLSVCDQWEVTGNWAGPGLKHAISLCYYSWMLHQGVYKHS